MRWIRGTAAIEQPLLRPVLTIGNFDGLHLGHRSIVETVVDRARILDGTAVVYTFDPHPRAVLQPEQAPRMLVTLDQKLELLEDLGVDLAIVEPFDAQFAEVASDAFVVDYVHGRIRPCEVYVGYDFHFGRDREGSMRLLTETGPQLGFAVTVIPELRVGGRDVNSTRIRELLTAGQVEQAGLLLGRPFSIRGEVVEGDRRGRELGFPTANLATRNEVLPAAGVYAGRLRRRGSPQASVEEALPVVANVGERPTFQDGHGLVAEAHVLDFDGDLYGETVDLAFEHRIRDEQRFPSAEALRQQIVLDADEARNRLAVGR